MNETSEKKPLLTRAKGAVLHRIRQWAKDLLLFRILQGEYRRAELRSPDPICNPYIAYTLLIYAGLDGIRRRAELPASADINFYTASEEVRSQYKTLPATLADAKAAAKTSEFIASSLPRTVVEYYTK